MNGSGRVIIFARASKSLSRMNVFALEKKKIKKQYWAIVEEKLTNMSRQWIQASGLRKTKKKNSLRLTKNGS